MIDARFLESMGLGSLYWCGVLALTLCWCNVLALTQAKRQQRKLNFLITQTELYAHFIGKKLTGEVDQSDAILQQLEDTPLTREIRPGVSVRLEEPEEYDSEVVKAQVLANVQSVFLKQQNKVKLGAVVTNCMWSS